MATWELWEGGHHYDTVKTRTQEQAMRRVRAGVDRDNYLCDPPESTLRIHVRIVCRALELEESDVVTLPPEPPACAPGKKHKWEAPYELLGGCEENPGVWGHGGGVVIQEVCLRCGCGRKTDTWATDPTDGTTYEDVSYQPGAYEQVGEPPEREWRPSAE